MMRVAKLRPMEFVSCLRHVQDTFCIKSPPPPPYLVSKIAAITVSEPMYFGREDYCQVSQQRGNPDSKPGHSRVLFHFFFTQENGEWRPILNLKPLNAFVVVPFMKMGTVQAVRKLLGQHLSIYKMPTYTFQFTWRFGSTYASFSAYQFRVLPFGLATSPRVFARYIC